MSEQMPATNEKNADGPSISNDGLGLLPCPFCGALAKLDVEEMRIDCSRCFAAVIYPSQSEEHLVDAWNRRA